MRHTYSATGSVASADEAEAWARSTCDAYFGDQPYDFTVSASEQHTLNGTVPGYRVTRRCRGHWTGPPTITLTADANGVECSE